MDTTVIFSPNECPGLCQHSFEKFLLYGRKCLEKNSWKRGDKECAIGINVSLSNKYKGIFETTKQGRRNKKCNAQKIERLCEMTAQASFLYYFADVLCTPSLYCKKPYL